MRFALFLGLFTIGCSVPDYTFNGVEPPDATNADTALETSVASDTATPDTAMPDSPGGCMSDSECGKAEWCSDGKCVPGCKDDSDCVTSTGDAGVDADEPDASIAIAKCDPAAHMCVGCKSDDQCPLGFLCKTDGVCRPGCTEARGCEAGRACCSGACLDTTRDVANCGGCGKACASPTGTTMKCESGACAIASCSTGLADCNSDPSDGCETNVLTSLANCGGCGTACTITNGTGVCTGGVCKVASCTPGFANCDGDGATGCEINLASDPNNCGGCNVKCPTASGTPVCAAGVCKYSGCSSGFGDCDGTGACSTVLTGNINHCGACGRACVATNGTPACTGTDCTVASCNAGYGDCNTTAGDGCEQKLDTIAHCGACGAACTRTNATATCSTGSCAIASCNANFGNCDGVDSNGCERSLLTDVNHCGTCGKACAVTNGTPACTGGACGVGACNTGFANCDTNATDCERDLTASTNTCGAPERLRDSSANDLCGYGSGDTVTATTNTTRYYRVRLLNSGCSTAGGCNSSSNPVRARISVKSPSGVAYDLRVYSNSGCSTLVGSSISGTLGGTETVTYDAGSCSSTRDLWFEVKYRAGVSCANATVTVNAGYSPYP